MTIEIFRPINSINGITLGETFSYRVNEMANMLPVLSPEMKQRTLLQI
jgi:hypothetical protein